jgi:hypothetical protein
MRGRVAAGGPWPGQVFSAGKTGHRGLSATSFEAESPGGIAAKPHISALGVSRVPRTDQLLPGEARMHQLAVTPPGGTVGNITGRIKEGDDDCTAAGDRLELQPRRRC